MPRTGSVGSGAAVIIVYTLAHVLSVLGAAANAARPVILLSATNAGVYAGPGWFGAVIEAAAKVVPEAVFTALLDCGDRPGAALATIRAGVHGIIFTGRSDVADRLADIAHQRGISFLTQRPTAGLDLLDDFFAAEPAIEQRCADFLGRAAAQA